MLALGRSALQHACSRQKCPSPRPPHARAGKPNYPVLIHPKKPHLGAPGLTHEEEPSSQIRPPPQGSASPRCGGKRERNQTGEWEKRKPERWKNPSPKISCPKRAEVGATPSYRSIRLDFRKCPLISIYFNENFGSS